MGKMILQVDVQEILSLAWDHPVVTGFLVLMFTPPLFPVVVFFSPLLISTALVAVALISAGRPVEAKEREVTWWNSKGAEEDNFTPKVEEGKTQGRFPGEERFLEWFHSLQTASLRSSPRSSPPLTPPRTPMAEIKGKRSVFRPDESTIDFVKEDFTSRQLTGLRDYERSFSFRTGERVAAAAGIGPVSSPPALPSASPPAMQMISIPSESDQFDDASAPQMPSIFLYDHRSGGMGTAEKYHGDEAFTNGPPKARAVPPATPSSQIDASNELVPFGSFSMSEIIDAVERAQDDDLDPEPQRSIFEMGRGATATAMSKVSPTKALTNKTNVAAKKSDRQRSIMPNRTSEEEFVGFPTAEFGVEDRPQSFLASPSAKFFPRDSGGTISSKTLTDDSKALPYNATLRADNVVVYNPSSNSNSTKGTSDRQGFPPVQRKVSVNRDRVQSSASRTWKAPSWQSPSPSWQIPPSTNRQTPPSTDWQTPPSTTWQTPPSPTWRTPPSKTWETPPSTWQSPSPARAQPYSSWQDSPLPSWQESPARQKRDNFRSSRSIGLRKLDEYNRIQSAMNEKR